MTYEDGGTREDSMEERPRRRNEDPSTYEDGRTRFKLGDPVNQAQESNPSSQPKFSQVPQNNFTKLQDPSSFNHT